MISWYDAYKNCPTPEQDAFQDYIYGEDTSRKERSYTSGCYDRRPEVQAYIDDFDNILNRSRVSSVFIRREIAVVHQKVMDSFWRIGANALNDEAKGVRWKPCDFIAHLSEGSPEDRENAVKDVLNQVKIYPSACNHLPY